MEQKVLKYSFMKAGPRVLCALALMVFWGMPLKAQRFSSSEIKEFTKREDSLKKFSASIVFADEPEQRLRADSQFTKTLVRTLKMKNSFFYPLDSLQTISRLYAPDSSFRIFTWQFKKDEFFYLQRGAIQMRTPDGSLKLFGLHDVSMFTDKPEDSVRTANNWIGAIYYRIIQKTFNGRNYYTLLGFDDYSIASNKKWMEILTFGSNGEPLFGGPYISFKDDSVKKMAQGTVKWRFNIEYKKDASTTFNYDPQMDMIIFDQLISESEEPDKKESYVPSGDYEGFKWVDGQWLHTVKVFDYKLKDGQFPQDEKILDESGSLNEQKLMEQSDKNLQHADDKKKKNSAKPPVKKDGNN